MTGVGDEESPVELGQMVTQICSGQGVRTAQLVEHRTGDWKITTLIPGRSVSSLQITFCAVSHSTPTAP